jgi:hypothetical protein
MFREFKIPHFEALSGNHYFVINLGVSTFEIENNPINFRSDLKVLVIKIN